MSSRFFGAFAFVVATAALSSGCNSPYRSDRGALYGGLGGAGIGALVGNAVGHPGVGAAVGAGVGAVSGAAIGGSLDEIEANNRAQIEARLGRPVAARPVTTGEVVDMTRGGVNEELIINHVRSHGLATQLQSNDLIFLQQQGVSPRVVATMQQPPTPQVVQGPVMAGPPVMMAPAPVYYPPYPVYQTWRPQPGIGVGVAVGN